MVVVVCRVWQWHLCAGVNSKNAKTLAMETGKLARRFGWFYSCLPFCMGLIDAVTSVCLLENYCSCNANVFPNKGDFYNFFFIPTFHINQFLSNNRNLLTSNSPQFKMMPVQRLEVKIWSCWVKKIWSCFSGVLLMNIQIFGTNGPQVRDKLTLSFFSINQILREDWDGLMVNNSKIKSCDNACTDSLFG